MWKWYLTNGKLISKRKKWAITPNYGLYSTVEVKSSQSNTLYFLLLYANFWSRFLTSTEDATKCVQ